MRQIFFFCLLLSALSVLCSQVYPTWEQYCVQFEKNCTDMERKSIYEARIEQFQKDSGKTYTLAINKFTDRTPSELKARRKGYKVGSRQTNKVSSPNLLTGSVSAAPASFDWTVEGVVTSVKDQGTCGSCWAFATIAAAESKLIIDKRYGLEIDLSQQYMLECTWLSGCDGGYLAYAMITAKQVPPQSVYPYDPYKYNFGICSADGIEVAKSTFEEFDVDDERIIDLLLTYGPLPIGIATDYMWQLYESGVYECPAYAEIDHAVLLVGYTADEWIIKNQWGTLWGENGFMRITRNRTLNKNCYIGIEVYYFTGTPTSTYVQPTPSNTTEEEVNQQQQLNNQKLVVYSLLFINLILLLIL